MGTRTGLPPIRLSNCRNCLDGRLLILFGVDLGDARAMVAEDDAGDDEFGPLRDPMMVARQPQADASST